MPIKKEYRTDAIAVVWEPDFCIHVANCIRHLPQVFDPRDRPWIHVDQAAADEIARAVLSCPTGALHYRRLDQGAQETRPPETEVRPQPNGPLYLHGNLRIEDDAGVIREETRTALCRCGESRNKPFCDNTHRLIGFESR